MEHKILNEISSCDVVFDIDNNSRIIKSYLINDGQFDTVKIFYPEVLIYSKSDKNTYNPIDEKILSLEKLKIKKLINLNLGKITDSVDTPVFYFIYNTENYYHFIYDTLPYLITYLELKKRIPNLKLLVNYPNSKISKMYDFVLEFLNILDITKEDLLFVNCHTVYKHIYISSSYTHGHDSNLPPRYEIYDFFKKIVNSKLNYLNFNTPKNIYVSRRSWIHNDFSNIGTNYTQTRKMVNEDTLVEILMSKKYTEIFTEKLSTIEKLSLFYNAKNVVGAIGGGICNVLFSKPETNLLSIVSPTFLDVNNRFKYSLNTVNTNYFTNTYHFESSEFKTGMRVQCESLSIYGEIKKVNDSNLTIIYSENAVSGWNNQISYNEIKVDKGLCSKLDDGLNSPFIVDLEKIKNLIH